MPEYSGYTNGGYNREISCDRCPESTRFHRLATTAVSFGVIPAALALEFSPSIFINNGLPSQNLRIVFKIRIMIVLKKFVFLWRRQANLNLAQWLLVCDIHILMK